MTLPFQGATTIGQWTEGELAAFVRRVAANNTELPAGLKLNDLVVENLLVEGILDLGSVTEGSPDSTSGIIQMYGGSTAPTGYLLCDGSAVSRTTYAALFVAISTRYGSGDGSTTFNVPNFNQKFPLGKAASGTGATLGDTGGSIDHTHTGPSHSHTATTNMSVTGTNLGTTPGSFGWVFTNGVASPSVTVGSGGTGNTGSANPPYLVVNFIIKT